MELLSLAEYRASPSKRATITVILSSPPRSLALSTRDRQASVRSSKLCTISRISLGGILFDSPSLQITRQSFRKSWTALIATFTAGCVAHSCLNKFFGTEAILSGVVAPGSTHKPSREFFFVCCLFFLLRVGEVWVTTVSSGDEL